MKQRVYYLDNVCCVLIIHMIYTYHVAGSCGGFKPSVISFIGTTLSFFMSWFFFKAGMMHGDVPTKQIFQKSVKRLLVPFLIFLLLGILINGCVDFTYNPSFDCISFIKRQAAEFCTLSIVWPTVASWFLLSLFAARVVFNVLYKRINPLIITIAFAFFAYAVYLMNCNGWGLHFYISGYDSPFGIPTFYMGTMCHGLSVYSLGYYLKEKQFNRKVFFAALALFVLKYFIPSGIDFRANYPSDANFMLSVLCDMSGCVVINNIFRRLCDVRLPFVTYVGSNSMVYYLVHYPVLFVTITLFWEPFAEKEFWYRFLVLSAVVTVFLIIAEYVFRNKRLRFVVGG